MDNKMNNMIKEFLENTDAKNEEELNEALGKFFEQYNNGKIEYENTPLDEAYELLEEAENAKTIKDAKRLAKKAFETSNACFDAKLFLADIEDNSIKSRKILNEGLEFEKKRLEQEGFFDKENIGSFYGLFETRPYIRGLYTKAHNLSNQGKYKKAIDVCKEILRLNENDNTGARYLLMALYAVIEDEKAMLDLYKKYNEEINLEMLFPLFVLYYKKEDDGNAKKYLDMINKNNKHFIKFFKETIKLEEDSMPGYYSRGNASEVLMYMREYFFLVCTLSNIDDYIIENTKKSKN